MELNLKELTGQLIEEINAFKKEQARRVDWAAGSVCSPVMSPMTARRAVGYHSSLAHTPGRSPCCALATRTSTDPAM